VVGIALLLAGLWYYFTTGHAPVAVTDPSMPFEKKLANSALHARIDKDPHTDPPVPAADSSYLPAANNYKQHCAVCHGLPGEPQSLIAQGMFPKPPELFHGTGVTDDPAWESYWKIKNGIRLSGMPGFQTRLSDTELWQVSVLVANADKISPAVRAALTSASAVTPPPTSAPIVPTKK
jgi:mono/diheme cytochrome c family protein